MKTKEVRNLDNDQLVEKVREFREELFNLRFRNATGELENTARMGEAQAFAGARADDRAASGTSTSKPSCER